MSGGNNNNEEEAELPLTETDFVAPAENELSLKS
jgi:hypothetical protein